METQNETLNEYKLHWLTGDVQTVTGRTIVEACNKAGIGRGAIRALDYYEEVRSVEEE